MDERISWFHWVVAAVVMTLALPVLLIPAATLALALLPLAVVFVPSVVLLGRS